jgi:hypothetical protein
MQSSHTFTCCTLVYVLKLRDECWYIGHTTNLNARIAEHLGFTGRYSKQKFLTLHPVENIHSVQIGSLDDENKLALEYIDKYGREKVRGGKWCKDPVVYIKLEPWLKQLTVGTVVKKQNWFYARK